jgi:hypothetical protein
MSSTTRFGRPAETFVHVGVTAPAFVLRCTLPLEVPTYSVPASPGAGPSAVMSCVQSLPLLLTHGSPVRSPLTGVHEDAPFVVRQTRAVPMYSNCEFAGLIVNGV